MIAHEWNIELQYGVDGQILLSWDPSSLDSLGSFIIEDAFGGLMFSIDMSTQSELLIQNPHTLVKVRVTPDDFFEWVYTPGLQYIGVDGFSYSAFDGELYSQPSDVSIYIGSENDAPVLSYIGPQETDEDVPLSIEISATDSDPGTDLTFAVESDTSAVEAEIQDGLLTLSPLLNWHGTAMITVTVSDNFLEDSETFAFTVHPVNCLLYTSPSPRA